MLKRVALAALSSIALSIPVAAQVGSPNLTPGPVTRITLMRITPGHADEFWADMRQHQKKIVEEYKRRGIITDYSVMTKVTTDDPNDWNVATSVSYKNWAALDDMGAKTDPVTLAHYGSVAQRNAAADSRRPHSTTVSSFLVRHQTVNDWK